MSYQVLARKWRPNDFSEVVGQEHVVQALARIVITDQMLDIQNLPEVDIVMQVHDEIIAIGSKLQADDTMNQIIDIMRTPPEWCDDLPLDAEGGVSKVYDK